MGGNLFEQEPADSVLAHGAELPYVENRGGRRTAFDPARLKNSIERAQRDAGETVTSLAAEIADIVRFTLASRVSRSPSSSDGGPGRPRPLHVDEIGALVERALIEVGATGSARSYIVARDRRMRAREAGDTGGGALGPPSGAGPAPGSRMPSVRGGSGAEPFQSRRIVAVLIEEAGLLPAQAEEVAAGVEGILRGAGLRVVSTGLVRELVSSQLLARGLGEALRRHESIGIPRHDLAQLFQGAASEVGPGERRGEPFEAQVRGALLTRWFLDDVLDSAVAEAHRRGDLFVSGLGLLHRVRTRAIPASLVLRGSAQGAAMGALTRIARLSKDTGGSLVIEDAHLLGHALRGPGAVGDFLAALGAVADAADRRIDLALGVDSSDAAAWLEGLAETCLQGQASPRLLAPLGTVARAVEAGGGDAAESLLRSGTWSPFGCPRGRAGQG